MVVVRHIPAELRLHSQIGCVNAVTKLMKLRAIVVKSHQPLPWTATDLKHNLPADGRRHYNSVRHFHQLNRRVKLTKVARSLNLNIFDRRAPAALAGRLGVHRSTISPDIQAMLREANERGKVVCPCCSTVVPRERIRFPRGIATLFGGSRANGPNEGAARA